ncbi:Zn-dependent hydrolase [Bacillus taeanensis]|uniref:Allantoate amidohydrolase n=1 Tax=Bacillus taeanensis TaxID=273032 RepID=A0A366XW36_9BACI|nr:Zn-dependent hydrolase [Bacillus taeanensis]RBW69778.1 allantoate amidohydrolase [Bacillus taeanensis]
MERKIDTIQEAIDWLSQYGEQFDGGVTRLLYSNAWQKAQEALRSWMDSLDIKTYYDKIGNLFGKLSSEDENAGVILVGSHIDTVKQGGKYDGAYGIVAGILALNVLKQKYGSPKRHIEVVSLCEEEGSRFPIACWGSGMLTGVLTYKDIRGLKDSEGVMFEEAMNDAGFSLTDRSYNIRSDIEGFIELHIEQGQVLEKLQKPIGIVQAIVGQRRFQITVCGESNHAGTTPMNWRKDPVHGAVEMIHKLLASVDHYDENLVTTVGQIEVKPNVSNVIADSVVFTVDVRHPNEKVLNIFCESFLQNFKQIAYELNVEMTSHLWHEVCSAEMDDHFTKVLKNVCKKRQISYHVMNSGAGHDAQLFASFCPTALLFVPSQGGISHSSLEYTAPAHLETGLHVLIDTLYELAY